MERLCVFCGSKPGVNPLFAQSARSLAGAMAARGINLVFGGGHVGLMGILADAALAAGLRVHGVIPEKLMQLEVGHRGLTTLDITADMHERKARMAELADGFVALPGGLGTLEELFEVWTWGQLGMHHKPIGLLNSGGFYDPLLSFLGNARSEQFVTDAHLARLQVASDPDTLLTDMISARQ